VDLVAEGVDVALRAAPRLEDSTLVVRRAAPIVFQLYASPVYLARRGTPRTEADLAGHDFVLFRGGPEKLRAPRSRSGAPERAARIACDDLLFLHHAVRAGAGLGLMPAFVAEEDVRAGRLVRVLPRLERPLGWLHIVTPAAKHVPRKVTAFRDLVLEVLAARAAAPGAG